MKYPIFILESIILSLSKNLLSINSKKLWKILRIQREGVLISSLNVSSLEIYHANLTVETLWIHFHLTTYGKLDLLKLIGKLNQSSQLIWLEMS